MLKKVEYSKKCNDTDEVFDFLANSDFAYSEEELKNINAERERLEKKIGSVALNARLRAIRECVRFGLTNTKISKIIGVSVTTFTRKNILYRSVYEKARNGFVYKVYRRLTEYGLKTGNLQILQWLLMNFGLRQEIIDRRPSIQLSKANSISEKIKMIDTSFENKEIDFDEYSKMSNAIMQQYNLTNDVILERMDKIELLLNKTNGKGQYN